MQAALATATPRWSRCAARPDASSTSLLRPTTRCSTPLSPRRVCCTTTHGRQRTIRSSHLLATRLSTKPSLSAERTRTRGGGRTEACTVSRACRVDVCSSSATGRTKALTTISRTRSNVATLIGSLMRRASPSAGMQRRLVCAGTTQLCCRRRQMSGTTTVLCLASSPTATA